MPHIELDPTLPGIRSLFSYNPETAKPLSELAEILLRGDSSLTRADRELIATHVSYLNDCQYCQSAHGAIASVQLGDNDALVDRVKRDPETAPVSAKLKALLRIAGAVQQSGKAVTEDMVTTARAAGASDREIHDTVLIAAMFCLCNRYVDGLGTLTPDDPATYKRRAEQICQDGYLGILPQLHGKGAAV